MLPLQGAQVQSLVRELRSRMLHSAAKKNTFLHKVHEWGIIIILLKLFQLYLLYNVWINNYFLMHIGIFIIKHFWAIQDHIYVVFCPCILELLFICVTGQLAGFHLFTTVFILFSLLHPSFMRSLEVCFREGGRESCVFPTHHPIPVSYDCSEWEIPVSAFGDHFLLYNGNQDEERKNPT